MSIPSEQHTNASQEHDQAGRAEAEHAPPSPSHHGSADDTSAHDSSAHDSSAPADRSQPDEPTPGPQASASPRQNPTEHPEPDAPEPDAAEPDAVKQDATEPDARPQLSAEVQAEIDSAMAAMDQADREADEAGVDPRQDAPGTTSPGGAPGPAKAKLRGPRVVQGGREHRTGMVVSVGPTDVFVEFGPKELGVLERQQFKTDADLPEVGSPLAVVVQRYEPTESLYICSIPGAIQKADWEMLEQGQNVEARVTGTNKGGLEIEVAGHRAFMPASQVDIDRVPDLSVFVGEKLECVVQRIDRSGRGNIVLSRRELLKVKREEAAKALRETLQEGQTVEGRVRKIMPFGAFVDLGGVDGLVHIADLSHDRVNHGEKNVARHVSEGQQVRVKILKVDWDANRISLGMKQLEADPFEAAASEVVEGAELTGKVTKCLDFGAFVEVAPGIEGLVHISELDHRRIAKVEDAVQPGEVVQVKVLKVDPSDRKVSLSIKALKDAPPPPRGSGGGSGGRGRGRGDRDDRSPDEILKETPKLRRMREEAKKRERQQREEEQRTRGKGGGGLGDLGEFGGIGLGDLKL